MNLFSHVDNWKLHPFGTGDHHLHCWFLLRHGCHFKSTHSKENGDGESYLRGVSLSRYTYSRIRGICPTSSVGPRYLQSGALFRQHDHHRPGTVVSHGGQLVRLSNFDSLCRSAILFDQTVGDCLPSHYLLVFLYSIASTRCSLTQTVTDCRCCTII